MKIPRFQQSQRIEVGSPVAISGTSDARARGENIARLGQEIVQTAAAYSRFQAVKQGADTALHKNSWENEAQEYYQNLDILRHTKDSGKIAADGSNLLQYYDEGLQPLVDKAAAITDGHRRQIALNAINDVRLRGRARLADEQIKMYNSHMFSQGESSIHSMGNIILKDPTQFSDALLKTKEFIAAMPYGEANKKIMIEKAEEQAALAAISSYTEKGDFDTARALVKGELGSLLNSEKNPDAQIKMLETLETEEREYLRWQWTKEDQRREELKERAEEDRERALTELYDGMFSSGFGPESEAIVTRARAMMRAGKINPSDFQALTRADNRVLVQKSNETYLRLTERMIEGDNLKTLHSDINDAVINKQMTANHARLLLKELYKERTSKKHGTRTQYTERRSIGNGLINEAFLTSRFDFDGTEKALMANKKANAKTIAAELRAKGVDPVKAAAMAIKEVDPTNPVFRAGPVAGVKGGKEDLTTLLKELDRLGDRAPLQLKLKVQKLLLEKRKQEAGLKNQPIIDEILKGTGLGGN